VVHVTQQQRFSFFSFLITHLHRVMPWAGGLLSREIDGGTDRNEAHIKAKATVGTCEELCAIHDLGCLRHQLLDMGCCCMTHINVDLLVQVWAPSQRIALYDLGFLEHQLLDMSCWHDVEVRYVLRLALPALCSWAHISCLNLLIVSSDDARKEGERGCLLDRSKPLSSKVGHHKRAIA
jgi:hypothetical protein